LNNESDSVELQFRIHNFLNKERTSIALYYHQWYVPVCFSQMFIMFGTVWIYQQHQTHFQCFVKKQLGLAPLEIGELGRALLLA
jgi:hypothetical protein